MAVVERAQYTASGSQGMVASADALATEVGVGILRCGGNAVDAAVATNAAMAVVGPHLCGIGGDLFALVHTDHTVYALNASGRAGAGASAAAVRAEGDVDLVITGKQSVDENSSSVFIGVACKLGFPLAANVVRIVEIAGGRITVERIADGVQETVSLPLPAVISVGKEINDPRFPSFMGIRKANRASIPVVSAAGLDAGELVKRTNWTNSRKPDEKTEACVIFDGATAAEKAAKLVDALVSDKVL